MKFLPYLKWFAIGYFAIGLLFLLGFAIANWPLEMTAENIRLMAVCLFAWPYMLWFIILVLVHGF